MLLLQVLYSHYSLRLSEYVPLSVPPDGDDYMSLPDTITLATGTTSLQLGLMALTDTIVENTETFSFTVGGAATATVSIVDDTSMFIQAS